MDEIDAKKYVLATIKTGNSKRITAVVEAFRKKYRSNLHTQEVPDADRTNNLAKEIFGITA